MGFAANRRASSSGHAGIYIYISIYCSTWLVLSGIIQLMVSGGKGRYVSKSLTNI